jgi:hypothetical protein
MDVANGAFEFTPSTMKLCVKNDLVGERRRFIYIVDCTKLVRRCTSTGIRSGFGRFCGTSIVRRGCGGDVQHALEQQHRI